MVINCDFQNVFYQHCGNQMTCLVENQQLPENKVIEFYIRNGRRIPKNSVTFVKFNNCNVTKVPNGITTVFVNLKVLNIFNSKLKKISKEDIAEYRNLEQFFCQENEIEFLPGDLFDGFVNLIYVTFWGNKLKVIEPNILDGLVNLKHASFQKNVNYNCYYSTYPIFPHGISLADMKAELYEKFQKRFKFFEDMKESLEELNETATNLKKSELKWTYKYLELDNKVMNLNKTIQDLQESEKKLKSELAHQRLQQTQPRGQSPNPGPNLTIDIRAFIQEEATKDFQITIDGQNFPVHKFLLAARSPTLAEILKNNPEVESLNLVDISVETFEMILKFLYTDELPGDDGTNFFHLFTAAGKLKIEKLLKFAGSKIINEINQENALTIFTISASFGLNDLKQKSFHFIKIKYKKINIKDYWIHNPETLIKIIEKFKKKEEAVKEFEKELDKLAI
ncbi:unnamed protein product [Chironomus riparius]|uniref:BTB domain-containing protein n=1 Tax=Chironomus riparius TaxID=315576 RepID=A0A9N9WVU0_9DIPT|nr:unnamed protein product [Chironomus riparius]